MMKSMVAENGVTFKELEKNIFTWICQVGQQFTKEFLERYDQMLMQERDKEKYRHKGIRQTTVKTVYGEVTYSRVVYEVTEKLKRPVFEEEKVEELYGEILMAAKAPRKDGKGYAYPVMGHLVGLEGRIRGDGRKLLAMAGY